MLRPRERRYLLGMGVPLRPCLAPPIAPGRRSVILKGVLSARGVLDQAEGPGVPLRRPAPAGRLGLATASTSLESAVRVVRAYAPWFAVEEARECPTRPHGTRCVGSQRRRRPPACSSWPAASRRRLGRRVPTRRWRRRRRPPCTTPHMPR